MRVNNLPPLRMRQKQVGAIIDELGGTSHVAKMLGVQPSAVSNWRRDGRLPARTYLPLIDRLKGSDIVLFGYLWGMADITVGRDL